MNTVVIDYNPQSSSTDEFLRNAQIISDAFSKALDQNECDVKLLIGLREQIKNHRNTLDDLNDIINRPVTPNINTPGNGNNSYNPNDWEYKPFDYTNPELVNEILKRLKRRCIDCDFKFPKVKLHNSLKFSFDKLKVSLDTYKMSFKGLNPNFCHVAGAFNWSCLQDLIKLITLLLSTYSAILALRKISGISLSVFIKGVITGLLGQIVGNLRLQVDLSQTGLACLIRAFEEIANNIPDGSSINSHIPPGLLENLGMVLDRSDLTEAEFNKIVQLPDSLSVMIPEYKVVQNEDGTTENVFVGWVDPNAPSKTLSGRETELSKTTTDDDWEATVTVKSDYLDITRTRRPVKIKVEDITEHNHDDDWEAKVTVKSDYLDKTITRRPVRDAHKHSHSHTEALSTDSSAILAKFEQDNVKESENFSDQIKQVYSKTGSDPTKLSLYQRALRNFSDPKGENFLKSFTKAFKNDVEFYEQTVSNAFKYVNATIQQVIEDFNTNIAQIFGLIDYFQCEAERTGPDYVDILELITRIQNVINLLSSIISLVARKQIQKLCKTKGQAADLSNILTDDIKDTGSNDLDPVDIISDFIGKVVVYTNPSGNNNNNGGNSDLVPIIYDYDVKPLLPKLSFKTCSLNDFIKAHNPNVLIPTILDDVINNPNRPNGPYRPQDDGSLITGNPEDKGVPIKDVIDKNKWTKFPTQFVAPPIIRDDWVILDDKGNLTNISANNDNNYGLKNILDLIYNNPVDKDKQPEDNNEPSKDEYRSEIYTPFYSSASEKEKLTFENKCRDINDVLDIVGNLKGIK